jgi:hypothetical protein
MSMPGPLRQFDGPPNVWVGDFPFVWLPTVMVAAALLGHLLVFRRLAMVSVGVTDNRPPTTDPTDHPQTNEPPPRGPHIRPPTASPEERSDQTAKRAAVGAV